MMQSLDDCWFQKGTNAQYITLSLRRVGAEKMKILVDKSSVYLRTDLTPIAHYIFVTESLVQWFRIRSISHESVSKRDGEIILIY